MIPVLISVPFAVFGMVFQLSFITVGKAGLGATLSVIGGVLNIVLDWFVYLGVSVGAGRRCDCNEYRICISFGGRRHLVLCEPEADPACGSAEMAY